MSQEQEKISLVDDGFVLTAEKMREILDEIREEGKVSSVEDSLVLTNEKVKEILRLKERAWRARVEQGLMWGEVKALVEKLGGVWKVEGVRMSRRGRRKMS